MNSLTIRLPAPYTESIILESGMTMKKVPLADYQAMEAQSAEWRVKAAALDKELQAARDDAKHLREQLNKQQAETASLTRELDELLSTIKRYGDSQTSVELKTYFESKDIPMPE